MEHAVAFGSRDYFLFLGLLALGRGMDLLSTLVATPNLRLEANPIMRRLGWRGSLLVNVVTCLGFALWPLPAVIISTTSLLVAARNFEWAWLMRSMGEEDYQAFIADRLAVTPRSLVFLSLFGQTFLFALVGLGLVLFSGGQFWGFATGAGMLGYAGAVFLYSGLSLWRRRRH
ncbi:MAG: hypothetical protein RJA22_2460 [Verrucomicrobiota bacterium]|jgi:small-conductance mechanosensitive channel